MIGSRQLIEQEAARRRLAAALVNLTAAGGNVHLEHAPATAAKNLPILMISSATPQMPSVDGFTLQFIISGTTAADYDATPQMDDCGICIDPLTLAAECMLREIVEALECADLSACDGCSRAEIALGAMSINAEGSKATATVRVVVTLDLQLDYRHMRARR